MDVTDETASVTSKGSSAAAPESACQSHSSTSSSSADDDCVMSHAQLLPCDSGCPPHAQLCQPPGDLLWGIEWHVCPQCGSHPKALLEPQPGQEQAAVEKAAALHLQMKRIMLMRHVARCQAAPGTCLLGERCTQGKALWAHMQGCALQHSLSRCDYPRCHETRHLLYHYRWVQQPTCTMCSAVQSQLAQLRSHQQQEQRQDRDRERQERQRQEQQELQGPQQRQEGVQVQSIRMVNA